MQVAAILQRFVSRPTACQADEAAAAVQAKASIQIKLIQEVKAAAEAKAAAKAKAVAKAKSCSADAATFSQIIEILQQLDLQSHIPVFV